MTFFVRARHTPPFGARVLARDEWLQAREIAQRDPVAYILALTHIEHGIASGMQHGEIWGYPHEGPLEAVCWVGANLIPIIPKGTLDPASTREALTAFARLCAGLPRRSSSIVGPQELVLPLWELLGPAWQKPREIRASQPSMVINQPPLIDADEYVRPAQNEEFDLVLPASVHMFIEEVGVSPLAFGSNQYAGRVRELISERKTLIRLASTLNSSALSASSMQDQSTHLESVAFKSDFGAVIPQVAQVQGVWVNPQLRGQGLAAPAMAAAVNYGLENIAPAISLYVNDYNHRALNVYRKVGFEQVGEYATVLY